MKNKRKYAKSSERDTSVENKTKQKTKNKRAQHSISVVYQSCRNSQGVGSPRPSKAVEKHRTYIQFISNSKINTNSYHISRQDLAGIKKNMAITAMPRKNSPIPYSKGRKSALAKMAQPPSPSNRQFVQRNSFPRSLPHQSRKQNNPSSYFIVRGNNSNNKDKINTQRSTFQTENTKKNSFQTSFVKENENSSQIKTVKNLGMKKNMMNKTKQNKKPQNKSMNKQFLESEITQKMQKLNQQQAQLCQKLFKGIQFYRDLGKGAHALVRSAVDWNNKRKIAVKIYDKATLTQQELNSIERQVEILMSLNHPNIIKLYEIIQTLKAINLIMEYGGGNSLDQYIKSKSEGHLNEKEAKLIFRQILDAVKYLHEMNITHRDIKSENILLNKHLNLKIIDFGFSLVVGEMNKNINSYCGTPTYMAPEVVSKTPHNPQLADRWSLGILLFTMLNGHCPFRATTQKQLFAKINKGSFEYIRTINPLAKDMITKFLVKNPTERLSPKEALEHSWLQTE